MSNDFKPEFRLARWGGGHQGIYRWRPSKHYPWSRELTGIEEVIRDVHEWTLEQREALEVTS